VIDTKVNGSKSKHVPEAYRKRIRAIGSLMKKELIIKSENNKAGKWIRSENGPINGPINYAVILRQMGQKIGVARRWPGGGPIAPPIR